MTIGRCVFRQLTALKECKVKFCVMASLSIVLFQAVLVISFSLFACLSPSCHEAQGRSTDLQDFASAPLSLSLRGNQTYYAETHPLNARSFPATLDFGKQIPIEGVSRSTKFLWGIMSTNREEDKRRRDLIRHSYLSYYKNDSQTPHRICSLTDYEAGRIQQIESCEIIYTFVIGGATDKNAPTDLVDYGDNSRPLTLDRPVTSQEDDVIYLNIKENGKEGKAQTYFKWASTLVQNGKLQVDYIAKVDSDTMLFPSRWFSFVEGSLFPHPFNRRSGMRLWHCRQLVNKNYMSGEIYFMSPDLAEFIVSPELNRKPLIFYTEDFTIGNFVHSSPLPINQVVISPKHVLWEHGDQIKDPDAFERRWNEVRYSWQNQPVVATGDEETIAQFETDSKSFRSVADEFYRRIPWRWTPDFLAKWNLP
jgi:hypothetical protein